MTTNMDSYLGVSSLAFPVDCRKLRLSHRSQGSGRFPLYFSHAPLPRPRTGHPRSPPAPTPAPLDFPPHWHTHIFRRRGPEPRRTRLPPGLQPSPDLLFHPSPAVPGSSARVSP